MNLFEARYTHRSAFTQKPVSREELISIVKAGMCAPSGKNTQTTQFIIVDDKSLLNELAGIMGNVPYTNAPAAIIVLSEPVVSFAGQSFHIQDASAAIENMLLAITELGYASVWTEGVTQVEGRPEKIRNLLNIPDNLHIVCYLPIGEPVERGRQPQKKSFDERAFINGYKK